MPKPVAEDRRKLFRLLDERMRSSYSKLRGESRLESEGSLVKTYLLEAHLPEQASSNDVGGIIQTIFRESSGTAAAAFELRPTDEEFFFQIDVRSGKQEVTLFLDATNTRFWVAHTLSHSVAVDRALAKVTQSALLDHVWLYADLLESMSARGSFRGLGLDFDRRMVADIDLEAPDAPVGFLKMQLWHSKAADVLGVLRERFPAATTLSKIKLKYWNPETPEAFCLDDLKFNGKITARGTSFDTHMTLVSEVYAEYADIIRALESKYRLSWTAKAQRLYLDGMPVNFRFSKPVADLDRFCELLFSATPPFRLWGIPERVSENFTTVSAVDLHVGASIAFEISRDFVRMYLSNDACGNSVVRFFTNLQRHYDARVEALDADEQSIFRRRL